MKTHHIGSTADAPIGYATPPFPSLYWPYAGDSGDNTYLYYTTDIWKFTLYWTLIFFAAFYGAAGLYAALMHRKIMGGLYIILTYLMIGGIQACTSGTVVGLLLSIIYRAGFFSMTVWIPMCWGVIQILFVTMSSYSMMSIIL